MSNEANWKDFQDMAKQKYYIGINGGHSKSVAFAINDDLSTLEVVKSDSLNMHTYHIEQVLLRFENLINKLAIKAKVHPKELQNGTEKIVLSMPGAATPDEQALVKLCLSRAGWKELSKCIIVDDTWAGLVAGTASYIGTCAFAGTGASIYVNEERSGAGKFFFGKPHKIDGWGPTIGDFGSGFQLATDMFHLFNRELDNGNTPDLFYEVLKREPLIKELKNSQRWFDTLYIVSPRDWRIKFAQLAATATSAADLPNPDPHAKILVETSAANMTESIKIALKRFPKARDLPVVFQGGMFEYSNLYRELVLKAIKKITRHQVYLALLRPVVGAILLALGNLNRLPSQLSIKEIYRSILTKPEDERLLLLRPNGQAPFMEDG